MLDSTPVVIADREGVAISVVVAGVWFFYCLLEEPAPPLPVWASWAIALLVPSWWAFALWCWTASTTESPVQKESNQCTTQD
jgi:protein-S-isoprenylcysteine O-methyltransferase Ste14